MMKKNKSAKKIPRAPAKRIKRKSIPNSTSARRSVDFTRKVSLSEQMEQIDEHWRPKVVGKLNGQEVKLVKFQGEFVWHHHADEDELFLALRGSFRIEFRDRTVRLDPGEFLIVPHGVEHRPVADEEVEVLLFEPAATRNTGNVDHPTLTAPTYPKRQRQSLKTG
jgi:mannose-6-phosphate isomerase-like protein (cupin superfamily)